MSDIAFELETLDELPDESLKGLYKEDNGKFRLDLNAYGEHVKAPVVKKNKELLGLNAKNKEMAARLEKFKDFDDEALDEFQRYREEKANGGGKNLSESELAAKYEANFSAREKKLKEQFAKDLTEREAQIQDAQTKLNNYVLDAEISGWGTKYKADPEARKALLKLGRDYYRLDDKGQVIAVDEDGDPLPEKAEEHFASKFRNQHKYLFLSDETGGSGPNNSSAKGGRGGTYTLTRDQAKNPALYRKTKEAAEKAGKPFTVLD